MTGLRYGVVLLMLLTLAGGIWTRYHDAESAKVHYPLTIPPNFGNSGLQFTGTFSEPLGGLTGFEVSFPNCARPLAILPVPAWAFLEIIPTEYRYGPGEYSVFYVYNGIIYPEGLISYKLSLLNYFYRFQAFFDLADSRRIAYYLKIWIPPGCRRISNAEASLLEWSLVGPAEQNSSAS
jgi:hypothetical protein